MEVISAVVVLGIVIVGVSIMVGIVKLEDALRRIGQGLVFIFFGLIAVCMLKVLLASVVVPALISLKAMMLRFIGFALGLAVLVGLARWATGNVQR